MTSTEKSAVRPTKQRLAVAAALAGFDDFRSAQEIHDLIRTQGGSVALATVYRTLSSLAEAGEIDMLRNDEVKPSIADAPTTTITTWCVAPAATPSRWSGRPSSTGPTQSRRRTDSQTSATPWNSSAPARIAVDPGSPGNQVGLGNAPP